MTCLEIKFASRVGNIVINLTDARNQRMLNTKSGGMKKVR